MGHDHDSSYDNITDWLKKAESRVIYLISCENLCHNRAKINIIRIVNVIIEF